MVGLFFTARCLLHNFIMQNGGADVFTMAYTPTEVKEPTMEANDDIPGGVQTTAKWTQFRQDLAQHMWANRGR